MSCVLRKLVIPAFLLPATCLLKVKNVQAEEGKERKSKDKRVLLKRPVRVAVIGAGIGAATTLHFWEQLNPSYPFIIDLYERNDYTGGRIKHINIDKYRLEAGSSFALRRNRYLWYLSQEMKLEKYTIEGKIHKLLKEGHHEVSQNIGKFGVWNPIERKFYVFEKYNDSLRNQFDILFHYGFFQFYRTVALPQRFLNGVNNIYVAQDNGVEFSDCQSMWDLMDGYGLTQIDAASYIHKSLTGGDLSSNWEEIADIKLAPVLDELIVGLNRSYVNQDITTNAMVTLTGICAMTGGKNQVWKLKQGNNTLCKRLIGNAKMNINQLNHDNQQLNVYLSHSVNTIEYNDNNESKYTLSIKNNKSDTNIIKDYDIIIVATPLHPKFANIKFKGFEQFGTFSKDLDIINSIEYINKVSTFIKGKLNKDFFDSNNQISSQAFNQTGEILVGNRKYNGNLASIARKVDLSDGYGIFRVYSKETLDEKEINSMFEQGAQKVGQENWLAYPNYAKKAVFPSIVLNQTQNSAIFYVNAIEAATSAMELMAISGRNIALLTDTFIENHFRFDK